MKLIIILIFGFLCLSKEKMCSLLGKITKKESKTTTNSYNYVYIDTLEFPDESEIIIAATVYSGYFKREYFNINFLIMFNYLIQSFNLYRTKYQ